MLNLISVFIGGGIGAIARYLISLNIIKTFGEIDLPVATFLINILGCFLLGLLYILFMEKFSSNTVIGLALTVGFCGAFTTFSTFSLEIIKLINNQQTLNALIYIALSVIVGLIFTVIGIHCGKFLIANN